MPKFLRRPVQVEAVRWNGEWFDGDVPEWLDDAVGNAGNFDSVIVGAGDNGDQAQVVTLDGTKTANPGDWIILEESDNLSVCNGSVFSELYEAVDA